MKIAVLFLTVSLILTQNLFAVSNYNSTQSTPLAQIIEECDSSALEKQEISDVLFAEKLKQVKEYYKTSIDKDWNNRNPIIDSLRQSFKECLTVAQRASYNVFMIEMFNDLPMWNRSFVGKWSDLPVSQWKRKQVTDAVADKVDKLFADQDALRQVDATPYVYLFNSEPLNQFDNLYQLLLTAAVEYCSTYYQNELRDSLIVELYKETKENASLQINTLAKDINLRRTDSLYLLKLDGLMAKFIDDDLVVQLVNMRLSCMFGSPSKKDKVSSEYYEQLLKDCDAAIDRFDDSEYLNSIKSFKADILAKSGRIAIPNQVYPNTQFTMSVIQQNNDHLEIVAYRVQDDVYASLDSLLPLNSYVRGKYINTLSDNIERIEKLLPPKSDIVFRELLKFNPHLYVEQKYDIEFSVKDIGNYLMVCRNGDNEILYVGAFCASRIAPLSIEHNGAFCLYATDFMSGKPIEHLEVEVYNGNNEMFDYTHIFTKSLSFDGFVKVLEKSDLVGHRYAARVIDGEDNYAPVINGYIYNTKTTNSSSSLKVSIFTDRKRYMLGDSVCFRGYLYDPGKKVLPNHKLKYYIKNPKELNIKSLSKEVVTDDWGGFGGGFAVPSNWMAGCYTIHTEYGSISIDVGDYKPPTIEIKMTTDRVDYSLGDSVKVQGVVNAHAGFPIGNAKVNYVVIRSGNSYFRSFSDINEENKVASRITASAEGKFDFSFFLEPQLGKENVDYTYTITTFVTTPTGETQSNEKKLYVGANSYKLKVDAPRNINRDGVNSVVVTAIDVYKDKRDGVEGSYKVMLGDSEVLSGLFTTGTSISVPWDSLKNGDYKFLFKVDRAVEVSRDIFIYSALDRVAPTDTVLFFQVTNYNFSAKRPLEFVLGSSEDEVYTLVELYDNQKKWYSKLYVTKSEMKQYTIPYNKEFPDDLKLVQTTIYKGKLYRSGDDVKRHIEKKEITLKLKSVREVALSGSQESLSFEVQDKETGKGVEADILVSIYDKSSDKPEENIYKPLNDKASLWIHGIYCESLSADFSVGTDEVIVVSYGTSDVMQLVGSIYRKEAERISHSDLPIEVRDNFNQTALFAVGIRTDSMGIADVNYKLPDVITAYSIKAFATLKSTASAVASSEFIASKSVMIMANLPQFFRIGDEVTVRANAINLTDKRIDANVRLELFDVSSKQVIENLERKVSIVSNSSEVITWSLPSMETDREIIGMRFIIDSPNHTDAEERIVPIIPSDERLIKGRSYFLSDDMPQVEINLKEMLVNSASDEVMYVTSGVPSLMLINTISNFDVDSEPISMLDYANRLHVYGLGSRLAHQHRNTIAEMAKEELSMPKHEEEEYGDILGISRGETSWNKKMKFTNVDFLQTLLNKEECSLEVRRCADAISESINLDGGFGWFNGMPSSFAVSAHLLDRYIALSEVRAFNGEIKEGVYTEVANYLDNYIVTRYNECVASGGKSELNSTVAYYLYVRSGLPSVEFGDEAQKVKDYYLKLVADGEWQELSIMGKAYIAMALKRMNVNNAQILENLSEFAVKNKTLGYYFPNAVLPMRGFIYCEVSAHSLLLRLYTRNETYADLANGLMEWIILQRKNQAWSANIATLDATWAVWDYYQSVEVTSQKSEIIVSSKAKLKTPMVLGSLISVPKVRKKPKAEVLTVKRIGSSPLFVDIMYSYKLPLKQIQKADNGFDITRKLYRLVGGEYVEIDDETVFNIGDQVLATYYIQNSENRSYVKVKVSRGGALEPINNTSGYENGYYREVRKSHNNYYFHLMPEGSTTIDEHFTVWYSGKFNDGFVSVQSLYEPTSNGNTTTYNMDVNTSIDVE